METGSFTLQGEMFIAGGHKFVVKRRKQPTPKKPELFLIQLQPFKYISSLFPTREEGLYTFDYENQLYMLKREDGKVVITEEE